MEDKKKNSNANQGVSSGIYGLGWLGALVYYISYATTFWEGVLGFLKALVWPAVLVYELLNILGHKKKGLALYQAFQQVVSVTANDLTFAGFNPDTYFGLNR